MFISKSKKSPFYQLTYLVNGKRTTISTKTTLLSEAVKFLNNFRTQVNDNSITTTHITFPELKKKTEQLNTFEQEKLNEQKITLDYFKNEYVNYCTPIRSKHYITSIKLSFKMFSESVGNIPLNKISPRIIDTFLVKKFSTTKRAAALYYRTLKAAFSKAVFWEYIEDNPFKKVKLPKIPKGFPHYITEYELQLIINETKEQNLKDIFLIAFYTGMRLAEILNMDWTWVNLSKEEIKVTCSDKFLTKSKKERIIPINPKIKTVLIKRFPKVHNKNESIYVFTKHTNIKLNEDYVSKKFKMAVLSAKIDNHIHFHSLRHSFASMLVQKGSSLYTVKELLGHESITTTEIYSHLQQQNLRDAVNLL